MPLYAFRHGKHVITRNFRVSERPKSIIVGGLEYKRSWADEKPGIPASAGWPLECVASGVAPSQAGELRDYLAKRGCPTEVTADGNPIYRNATHRKKALKLRGMHDKSAFY